MEAAINRARWFRVGLAVLSAGLVLGFIPLWVEGSSCGSAFRANPHDPALGSLSFEWCTDRRTSLRPFSLTLLAVGALVTCLAGPPKQLRLSFPNPWLRGLVVIACAIAGIVVLYGCTLLLGNFIIPALFTPADD
jgi:hypothetical protein